MNATIDDNILSPDHVEDPYSYFAVVRSNDPVHWNERYNAWFIHRYNDVLSALKDTTRFSSDRVWPAFAKLTAEEQNDRKTIYDILGDWLVLHDPPPHTRLRRLFSSAFTPRAIEKWRTRIEEIVCDVTHSTIVDHNPIDVIRDFAYPIPALVIAAMLGVPASDRDLFKAWSDDIMGLVFGARELEDRHRRAEHSLTLMSDYVRELIRYFRQNASDTLIGKLTDVQKVDSSLTDDEIVANCILFLFGGHETTTNLIGNGFRALMQWPQQYERLRSAPDLLRPAIEELLRFDGPSKTEVRIASEDVNVRGKVIRRGDMVYLVQASANRDPDVFSSPDVLDIERNEAPHVGFGFGLHYCLGAALARLEGSIAIDALIQNLQNPHPTGDERWIPTIISRGMESFPVEFELR